MNALRVDTMVRVKDSYQETMIVLWDEGTGFLMPLRLLTPLDAIKLRDELTHELERKMPKLKP